MCNIHHVSLMTMLTTKKCNFEIYFVLKILV